jgi:non-specific serine/threonine protein kinase
MHNFPPQPTSFIGRTEEIAEITDLLANPACRLLTLLGPGGMGKTRLAIQVATQMLNDASLSFDKLTNRRHEGFAQGAYFVSLQAIQSPAFLIPAIADAVNLPLHGQPPPRIQLLDYLRDKQMLFVLDNFEQLLPPPVSPPEGGMKGGVPLCPSSQAWSGPCTTVSTFLTQAADVAALST